MLKAVTRQASAVDEKIKRLPSGPVSTAYYFDHYATTEDIAVMVTEEDFFAAQRELVPSVSAKELEHYARVRQTFEAVEEKDPVEATQVTNGQNSLPSESSQTLKVNSRTKAKSKGKGKARESPEDSTNTTGAQMNSTQSKGKGKVIEGFRDTTYQDDEDLY
jgi:peroxin-6